MEVHGQHPIGAGHGEHIGDQPGGDRHAWLVLFVGPAVGVERHDRGDAAGARPLEGVDHDQELHDRVVHRARGRLHEEDVLLAHVLHDAHEDVVVGELEDVHLAQVRTQVTADQLRQRTVGVAGVDAELVGVHGDLLRRPSLARFYRLALRDLLIRPPRQAAQARPRRRKRRSRPPDRPRWAS